MIVKSQRERIVDATAAIVAEKGLAALTIPEIARRANVSHQTFYGIYPSKHDALLGAQKVGMHQALRMAVEAYDAQMPTGRWRSPRVCAPLIDYLASEPAHAHLSLVDTFGASPETIKTRDESCAPSRSTSTGLRARRRGRRGPRDRSPRRSSEACWQVLHHYIENDRINELPGAAPQLTYLLLTPFLGAKRAAEAALQPAEDPAGAA